MPIPVECQCRHVTLAPESRAGLSILCESCGRTLVVPRPPSMDTAEIEAARLREKREKAQQSFWTGLWLWLEGTVLTNKLVSGLILLSLIVLVGAVLLLADVFEAPLAVDRRDINTRQDIQQAVERDRFMKQQNLLSRARTAIHEEKPEEARRLLQECIEVKPTSSEADEARKLLDGLNTEAEGIP